MQSLPAAAALVFAATAIAACKNERPAPGASSPSGSAPSPSPSGSAQSRDAAPTIPVDAKRTVPADVRDRLSFRVVERAGGYELSDGAGKCKLALPSRPALEGGVAEQDNIDIFHAKATATGAVNVDIQLITALDGPLPPETMPEMAQLPVALAGASGGKVIRNEEIKLAGLPARQYELATPKERLFGWNVQIGASQVLLLSCVGPDKPETRASCEGVAKSLAIGS